MSAAAMRYCHENFPRGGHLYVIMMALSYLAEERHDPFTATTTFRELANEARVSKRQAFKSCQELERLGHLVIRGARGNGGKTTFGIRVLQPRPAPSNVVDFRLSEESTKYVVDGNTKGVVDDIFGQ